MPHTRSILIVSRAIYLSIAMRKSLRHLNGRMGGRKVVRLRCTDTLGMKLLSTKEYDLHTYIGLLHLYIKVFVTFKHFVQCYDKKV